jgi:hypothetical protein
MELQRLEELEAKLGIIFFPTNPIQARLHKNKVWSISIWLPSYQPPIVTLHKEVMFSRVIGEHYMEVHDSNLSNLYYIITHKKIMFWRL